MSTRTITYYLLGPGQMKDFVRATRLPSLGEAVTHREKEWIVSKIHWVTHQESPVIFRAVAEVSLYQPSHKNDIVNYGVSF